MLDSKEISRRIKGFARFLVETAAMLRKVHRWTQYSEIPDAERETVETHSLTTLWLTAAMLAVERAAGNTAPNGERIILGASLHDAGEGETGDVAYKVKIDPRIRAILRQIELEAVQKMFGSLPDPVRELFLDAYAVEDEVGKTLDGDFFNGVERIGYIMFAVPQVKKGRNSLIEVFERQHPEIMKLAERFISVRIFYEPYREYVEAKLAERATLRTSVDD